MTRKERNHAIHKLIIKHMGWPRKAQYFVVAEWLFMNEPLPWKAHISERQFYRLVKGFEKT